ncbi:MAG: hypothetical protein LBJ08_05660, partial [Bifidobacteriaceae bacterium]|nr:hypothetical protein [Bifidobacteriaceae bacterium]
MATRFSLWVAVGFPVDGHARGCGTSACPAWWAGFDSQQAPSAPSWGYGPRTQPARDPEPQLGAANTHPVRRVGGTGREPSPPATQNPNSAQPTHTQPLD